MGAVDGVAGPPAGRVTNPSLLPPYVAADFSAAEFERRIGGVRAGMRERDLTVLLVANPENVYYLTGLNHQGYFSFTLLILPLAGPPIIVARSMELPTLRTQVPHCELLLYADGDLPAEVVVDALARLTGPGQTIGIGRNAMFFPLDIWDHVRQTVADRTWADSDLVDVARAVKSAAEQGLTRRAAAMSDRAIQAGIAAAADGVTEREVAADIYRELVLAGSEHPGFAPFIRSSEILQQEHVTWRDRRLSPGTTVLMELSGCVYRYHAPLTRMVHLGEPSPAIRSAADAALAGITAVEEALRPGVLSGEVYAAWQAAVDERLGHGDYVRHHCGYTVGIGFPPSWVGGASVVGLRRGSAFEIRPGMVFHVLSWILGQYAEDFCVSDTMLVTEHGAEVLTTTPRGPLVA